MKERGLDYSLPTLADYPEWRALREASREALSRSEPDWDDANLSREVYARHAAGAEDGARTGRHYSFLIRKGDGALVGGVSLGPISDGAGMLGVWIGSPYVGRGFAVRASDAMLTIAFGILRMNAVGATVLADNEPSIRILEHLGFEFDPSRNVMMRILGQPRLHLFYAVTRDARRPGRRRG